MTSPGHVVTVAHRAGNAVGTALAAAAAGVDLVEADLHAYRGRVEVRHLKTMGPLPWLWDEHELVPASAPRMVLAELVSALADRLGDTQLMLDLKGVHPRLAPMTREAMRGAAPGLPYVVCTQHWWMLDTFVDEAGVRLVHSVGSARALRRLDRNLARRRTDGLSVDRRLLSEERGARLLTRAPLLMTWAVNTAEAYDDVVRFGANGVISDDLELLGRINRSAPYRVT